MMLTYLIRKNEAIYSIEWQLPWNPQGRRKYSFPCQDHCNWSMTFHKISWSFPYGGRCENALSLF